MRYKQYSLLFWTLLVYFKTAKGFDLYWATHSSVTKVSNLPTSTSRTQIHTGTAQDQIVGLALDIADGQLFWTDLSSALQNVGIWKSDINGQNKQRILSGNAVGVGQPTGLAVDWMNNMLYWTDSTQRTVEISDYSGNRRRTIITSGLSQPRGIISDPVNGYIYIGDQNLHQILRCKMDGTECGVWISTDKSSCIFWPNQLSIHYNTGRLYWADGWTSSICSCSLDGSNCITHNITADREKNVFGISVTGSTTIYYSTLNNRTMSVLDTSGNTDLSYDPNSRSYFMVSSESATQPIGNSPCAGSGCSDICLPHDPTNFTCACPSYSNRVMVDKTTCGSSSPDEFLLYADTEAGEIGMISAALNSVQNLRHPTTLIARAENPVAITFDTLNQEVYFSDIGTSTIEKVKLDGTGRTVLLSNNEGIDQVEGLALDTKQRRLYFSNHGYTDNGGVAFWHRIEMISLDKTQRRTIITDVMKPRGLYIDAQERYLYYTDWGSTPKVGRSTLDGFSTSDILTQSSHSLIRPNGVIILNNRLFAVDSKDLTGVNKFINASTTGMSANDVTLSGVNMEFPYGVTGNNNNLYISDAGLSSNSKLVKYDLSTKQLTQVSGFKKLTGIHFTKKSANNPQDLGVCSANQNPCEMESVCVTKPDATKATCLCKSDKLNYLAKDRKTCKVPQNYMLIADLDGLKMAALENSNDPHIYTLRHGTGRCGNFRGLTMDQTGKKIYYTSAESGKIYRANLDGSREEELMEHQNRIVHIAYSSGRLFWTSLYGCNDTLGGLYQWDLNPGLQPIQLKENITEPNAIAANARYVYWSDQTGINAYDVPRMRFHTGLVPQSSIITVSSLSLDNLGTLYIAYSNGSLVARKFPTKPFRPELEVREGNLTTGNGLFVSELYVYMTTSNNKIRIFNRVTKQNQMRRFTGFLSQPGQIVVIQEVSVLQQQQQQMIKPGICSSSVNRNCNTFDCNSDSVCGGNQKCCFGSTTSCSICENPDIASDSTYCELEIDGSTIPWSTRKGKYTDGCRECDCSNPKCQLSCPTLTCPTADQVSDGCCPVCTSIKLCPPDSKQPTISNCPTDEKQVTLPSDKSYVLLDFNKLSLDGISAQSCDNQPIKLSSLMPSNVTWSQNQQKLQITATDKYGTATCEVQLKVIDNTSPIITFCPESIDGVAKSDEGIIVEWQEPKATDNSGNVKILLGPNSRYNGQNFPVGADKVVYIAEDGAGNINNTCEFTVDIKKEEFKCPVPPIVQNGLLKCDSNGGKTVCNIERCNDGYVKFPDNDLTYECSGDDVWNPAFPDLFGLTSCFKPEPVEIKLPFVVVLVNCPNTKFSKNDLLNCLSISNTCPAPDSKISLCKHDRLQLIPSTTSGDTITIKGDTIGELQFGGNITAVIDNIYKANQKVVNFFEQSTYEILCPKIACNVDSQKTGSYARSNVSESCPVGSQLHKNIGGKPACVKCSPGKRYMSSLQICAKCAAGTYQDEPGQLTCIPCKLGLTSKEASYREAHCVKPEPIVGGSQVGFIVGIVIGILVLIIIVLAVVYCLKRRRSGVLGKGHYEGSFEPVDKRQSDYYDELHDDQYNVIPADHVPSNPNTADDGYMKAKDVDDGYCKAKDVNDGYVEANDVAQDRPLPDPYAKLGNNKSANADYEGLVSSPYEKLQAKKEKEETYTNPVYTADIN